MTVNYNLVHNDGQLSITVVVDGEMYVADKNSHGNIKDIVEAAIGGDPDVVDLFDIGRGINRKFENLSERVAVKGNTIYLDGDPAPEAISDAIMDNYEAGTDFEPLVNFLEKLANNPNQDSVEQLYGWITATGGLTITYDGNIVGYKGVQTTSEGYRSINAGRAIVNGEEVTGTIPNDIDDTIEMPRSEVTFNPSVGCSVGLHVGTWEYASRWGDGTTLEVEVNPRDVVSVPHDSGAQKMRVCRYTVTDVLDAPHNTPVKGFVVADYDEDVDFWGEADDDGFTISGSTGSYFWT